MSSKRESNREWGEITEAGVFSIALVMETLLHKGVLSKEEYERVRQYIESRSPSYNEFLENIPKMIEEV